MPRRRKAGAANVERILALDTSSTCVGWAVFDNGELVRHGKYRQAGDSHCEKLSRFSTWLRSMLKQFAPDQLIYEKPFSGRRRNAFGVLTMYVAVLLMVHWDHYAVEIPERNAVPAREVKRRNKMRKGQNHEANKKIGVLTANRLYKLRLKYKSNDKTKAVSQDDEADAILLGRAWLVSERSWLIRDEDDE